MQWSDISFQPPPRTLRQFAMLWLVFFGGLACWQGFIRQNEWFAVFAGLTAVAVGLPGLFVPGTVRLIYVGWMVLAFPIGWTVSRLILAIIYYGLFTPIGWIFRLLGRDALRLHRPSNAETYWLPKPAVTDPRQYFRQF